MSVGCEICVNAGVFSYVMEPFLGSQYDSVWTCTDRVQQSVVLLLTSTLHATQLYFLQVAWCTYVNGWLLQLQ